MPPTIVRQVWDGITVLTVSEPSLPVVRFAIGIRRGSACDPPGQSGALSTMLELLLRGTQKHTRAEFADALEELGSSLYASAGSEWAVVRGYSLSRHLEHTLDLCREALLEPAFDGEEHEDLRDELIDSLRAARDDDDTVADIFLRRALYRGHPHARSSAGEIPDLQEQTVAHLREAYARHIAQGELVFAFAGDITPERARAAIAPYAHALAPPPAWTEPAPPHVPEALRITVVDKPERTQVQFRLGRLAMPGIAPESLPFWLGVLAFGGTFTSPFTHEVRDQRGWSYHAHASFDRHRRTLGPVVLSSAPSMSDAVECLALELELYRQLAAGDVSSEAVELARTYALGRYPFQIATAADLLVPVLRQEIHGLPADDLFSFPKRVETVDQAALRAALRGTLQGETLEVVLVATAEQLVPALRQRFPSAAIEVIDYRDGLGLDDA